MADYKRKLYGTILGDLAGQPYEGKLSPNMDGFNIHNPNSHITDDTIMTLATAETILKGNITPKAFAETYRKFYEMYSNKAYNYGKRFVAWAKNPEKKLGTSFGNGCIMRITPIFYQKGKGSAIMEMEAMMSCFTSHVHPESTLAVAKFCNLMARAKAGFWGMKPIEVVPFEDFFCNAEETMQFLNQNVAYMTNTHATIKRVITFGGDTDTHASIMGEMANLRKRDISDLDVDYVHSKLDGYLRQVLINFNNKFPE